MSMEWNIALYVLGALDADERQQVERALRDDPALRAERDAWEQRLAPLQNLVAPHTPPAALWQRIEATLGWQAMPRSRGWGWRIPGLAGAAFAAFAVVLMSLWQGDPAPPEQQWTEMAIAVESQALWSARWRAERPQELQLVGQVSTGAGPEHDHQLWLVVPGEDLPRPLGILPRQAGTSVTLRWPGPLEGAALAVSAEPRGGSRQAGPSGPVVAVVPLDAV